MLFMFTVGCQRQSIPFSKLLASHHVNVYLSSFIAFTSISINEELSRSLNQFASSLEQSHMQQCTGIGSDLLGCARASMRGASPKA